MYVSGGVALLVFGIVPFNHQTVGAMFLGCCLGFVGPFFVRTT